MPSTSPDTLARRRLADWLDRTRRGHALHTQDHLAEMSGVPQQCISAYLNRRARPDAARATLISEATRGYIPVDGWLSDDERRNARRSRAA